MGLIATVVDVEMVAVVDGTIELELVYDDSPTDADDADDASSSLSMDTVLLTWLP